jgi:hypothetical protein
MLSREDGGVSTLHAAMRAVMCAAMCAATPNDSGIIMIAVTAVNRVMARGHISR